MNILMHVFTAYVHAFLLGLYVGMSVLVKNKQMEVPLEQLVPKQ